MNIGIITTWFERGAAYVSRIYAESLSKHGHTVFVYARGGENHFSKKAPEWNEENVTRDNKYTNFRIDVRKFYRWVKRYKLDCLFFNEQQDFSIVAKAKKKFPKIKIGAYIDYYTERTIPWFRIYDFVICNTLRHAQAMQGHPQSYYIQWGTNVDLYNNRNAHELGDKVVFFHSAGMSTRKGTDQLIRAFIKGELFKRSKLIIHTQIPLKNFTDESKESLEKYGIEIIEKTVSPPGLYYLGDVYVYPTKLDGLGLTMYEALACGLPVVTTDFPPMNETVTKDVGRLVRVKDFYCRQDAYYFPMAICDEDSLINAMNWYINHPLELKAQKKAAREFALNNYDINSKSQEISDAFANSTIRAIDNDLYKKILRHYKLYKPTFIIRMLQHRFVFNFINGFRKNGQ